MVTLLTIVVVVLDNIFVGDVFDVALVRVVVIGLSVEVVVFGLVDVVDRIVDGAGADLTRDAIDDAAGFVADTFDAVVVVAGFGATTDLKQETLNFPTDFVVICFGSYSPKIDNEKNIPLAQWDTRNSCCFRNR